MNLKKLITVEQLAECLDIELVSAKEILEGVIRLKPSEWIQIGRWLERNKK